MPSTPVSKSRFPLLTDEDFNNDILRAALLRKVDLDVVRVQDVGLSGETDSRVLDWAAREGRILFTHDVRTMKQHALERVQSGLPMPGVFVVPQSVPIGKAAEEVILLAVFSEPGEWEGQIRYLPL